MGRRDQKAHAGDLSFFVPDFGSSGVWRLAKFSGRLGWKRRQPIPRFTRIRHSYHWACLGHGLEWTLRGRLTSLSTKQLLFSPSLGKRARSIAAGVYCSKSHEGVELLGVGIALR